MTRRGSGSRPQAKGATPTGAAFRDQLIRAIPELTGYAVSLTRNPSEADDLVQDTLERALKKQALYVETGPLISWLNTMMRHRFIDRTRAQRRRELLEGVTLDEVVGRDAVKASQEDRRFLSELGGLLTRLPPTAMDLIMAVGVEGHGYDHAAACFNIPTGTIRSRLSRARTALRHASLTSATGSAAPGRRMPVASAARLQAPSRLPGS